MDSLARHFCMKLLKVGHTQAQLQPAGGGFLRCGMQSEGNFSRSKLAPVWLLELEWQADHVSVEQNRAIHICNELDDVTELGCHETPQVLLARRILPRRQPSWRVRNLISLLATGPASWISDA